MPRRRDRSTRRAAAWSATPCDAAWPRGRRGAETPCRRVGSGGRRCSPGGWRRRSRGRSRIGSGSRLDRGAGADAWDKARQRRPELVGQACDIVGRRVEFEGHVDGQHRLTPRRRDVAPRIAASRPCGSTSAGPWYTSTTVRPRRAAYRICVATSATPTDAAGRQNAGTTCPRYAVWMKSRVDSECSASPARGRRGCRAVPSATPGTRRRRGCRDRSTAPCRCRRPRPIAWLPNRNTTSKSSRTSASRALLTSLSTRPWGFDVTSTVVARPRRRRSDIR